jgi:hypothetical protein
VSGVVWFPFVFTFGKMKGKELQYPLVDKYGEQNTCRYNNDDEKKIMKRKHFVTCS